MKDLENDFFESLQSPRVEPLAARMRPRNLDEYVGQEHILSDGRLLRRAILSDQLSSLIFYGPPGTGKTTLAQVIANHTKSDFLILNAVLSGLAQIRESIHTAKRNFTMQARKTILFIDEVHRFNKNQQDALLPHVENGTIILIGATTENPFFEVNKALLSRSRIFELKSLSKDNLDTIFNYALSNQDRGYGNLNLTFSPEAKQHLIQTCNGDARSLLNAIELAVEPEKQVQKESIFISLAAAEESIQKRAVHYDKDGDAHYDTISAFIKSIRGSDSDAALYWMAKMLQAGEDPHFIFRRMIISASEDIGLADSECLNIVINCAKAFDYVGMPEGRYHLAHACLALCNAPKSNSTMGFFDAIATVEQVSQNQDEVPNHLKDKSRDGKQLGHGKGYLYPHAYKDHWVAQQYLPHGLMNKVFYHPSKQGQEKKIFDQLQARRELTWTVLLEKEHLQTHLNTSTPDHDHTWQQQNLDNFEQQMNWCKNTLLERAQLQHHDRVLDYHAGSGLITLEATRKITEGCVYSLAWNEHENEAIHKLCSNLDAFNAPVVLPLSRSKPLPRELSQIVFDKIILRHVWDQGICIETSLLELHKLTHPNTLLISYDYLIDAEQTLYETLLNFKLSEQEKKLAHQLKFLEQTFTKSLLDQNQFSSHRFNDPLPQWTCVQQQAHTIKLQKVFGANLIDSWFSTNSKLGKTVTELATPETVKTLNKLCLEKLADKPLSWTKKVLLACFKPIKT